ncbi:interferon-induced very large GTPase 1-like isoform X1 [Acipenser ruthenus]|uniref:interferon-induced very large GTPase 1-like isoform X1 n=1 Tax=Acipenser ruthenus TaxID=7906 RepID=UPI002740ED50|nr:interferon-induced very large GTPase 1-like isoform X1 [Acipenser ruthenus]XP_058862272.1 interferon-induced very large GTPase 1-like isoform X1 [Acipenser ruthenus]
MMEKETSEGEHQKESDQDRKELEKKLQDVGIDPHIWLPRLRGHLNITRAQALQYVGFKDYQKLQHYCEHEWEKEALQKLLNIQEKESQSKKRRDDQSKQSKKLQDEWSEAFKKRQQEARSALNELQHMQEKGRNRNDGIVKEKEEQLQLALQVPKEYWVHSGVPLQDLIKNMHKQLDLADCSVLKRDHLSDEEVLKCASGGLALEGIYKSNQLEDAMVKRERLLDVPESFSFSGPEQMPVLNQQDVSSREAESTFRKAMEKIGLSITCSAKAGFWGFGLEINTNVKSSSQSEQTCQSDSAHSYACTTKYNYIPLASCFFGKDQLHLSNSALRELKSIDEAYLKNNEEFSKQRCLEFFQRFGTHANQGPLHFGGIFWWKASSEGFSAHEMNEVKTLTSEALSTYVGASYSGPVLSFSAGVDATHSKSAGFASHDRREALWRNIELSVSKTGGPAEADSLLQWKTGLIASNKTWCVIDRGLQIVPVWDIIICNHKEDFRDAVKLANSLSAAYDMLTKHDKKAEVLCGGELNTLEVEAQAVLHGIRMWNVSTAEQHLMKLIEFKKKLTDEKKNVSVWTSIFLSDEVFQDFLTKLVATHTNSPCDDTVKIRFLMRHLLEDNIYDVGKENFPNRSSIVKWIHQSNNDHPSEVSVSEFSQLVKLLNQAKNDTQEVSYICGSEDSIRSAKVQSTRLITDALYTLRKSLINTQKIEEELLLLTISAVKGYSDKDNTFDHLLGWPEIEFLLSKLESAHAKYSSLRNESVAKAQAFLISTGLTVAADCTEVSSYEKKLRLAFMKAHLKETVSEEIAMLIDFSAEPVSGWDRLEEDLNNISKGTYQAMVKNVHNQEACLTKDLEDISKMKTQPKSTAREISVALSNKEWGVIERLGLQKYYPKKMSMSDILVIDRSALEDCQPSTEQELLFFFLQKLLMLDYKARDVFCNLKSTAQQTTSSTPTVAMSLDDFFCDGNTKINKNTEDEPKHIHPMDVQMAIYHCADSFLWQYIATKLSFCQYALPCLVPNPFTSNIEFPSWSFVQLKKSWKCSERADQQSKTAKCKSQSLYEAELPTVSFIRFGPSASSKSQILNNLLNSQKHNTFFHRHCKGSSAPRLFMDGVVERSWYFPGGKDDDVFDDCVAFTNLHGDAREHEKQFEFLLKTATINVVLLTGSDRNERGNAILQKLFNSPKPLICLCADMKVTPKEQQGTKVRIAAESRNEADLVEDLVTTIKRLLGSLKHTFSIKTCTGIARNLGFLIEEDHEHCKQGKSLAEALLAPLKSEKLSVIKDKYLPLQGELWHTWCKKNKELLHLQIKGNISVEQHKSHIEQAKNDIRKKQFSKASPMNNVIRTFLTNLQCNSEATKVFFLKWMEIFLYDLTSEQLSVLDDTQHEKWSKMQALKQRGGNTDRLQNELVQLSNERIASTFSLEHFLRELGQIYEALESQSSKQKVIFSLPEIAADMMISGYPIELMDGDASHVPLKWISSVLDKVIEKLGDQRVFVLSVLGIQSTGKSTLLNAMFGLQFAVSAGRCTRGAFMQLVRVKEDLRREKQLDYVLVVDTEGLRTLEVGKSTLNHDNELATFVIGLGNMTLINIFGENPSDMQDVIQIAVQAFLRMKQIHLTPSCMFVHQNVGEVTAGDKNMEGKRRMLEKLDDMSRTAAKQELCDVSCFNDVIRFDVNTHIHYFAHLWEGNPPMAPPNPSYSENVQKLKRMLLCSVTHQNTLTISGFKTRVQDLWSALLAENFVFSFKNTLEIAAYRKLEEMYADWTWRLRSRMLDIENKLKIKIEHDRGEVVEKKDLESDMQTEYNAVTKEMECYFSEHNDREILIQWKRKIEQQLADVKDQIIGETKRKFDKLVQQKKSCWDLEEKKSKYEDQLLQRSKELALRLKAKDLDEEKLKSEFRKLWSTWVYDVSSDMPPAKKTDVKIEMEQILIERLVGESLCKRMEIGSYRNLQYFLNFSNYILINTRFFKNMITSEEANQLSLRLTQDIIHSVNESIKVKERANVDYSPTFIHEIVNKIGKDIQDFQSKEKRFVLKNNYKTDLCLMLCYQAAQRFQEMHNAFQTANDPLTYLKNKKEGYFGIFATFCKGATSTTGLADFVGSQLKEAIRQEVYNKTNADLAGEIRSNTPAFKGNRSNLESHILKTLAEDENFDKFMEYIHHPKQYFEEFINQSIDSYCWDGKDPRILKVFRKSLEHFKIRVLTAISKSTEVVQDKNGDVPMWLDEFCGELKEDLEFTRRDLKSVEYQEINDIRFLEEAMTTVLEHVVEDLEKDFRLESSTNTKSSRTEIQEKLFDHLCGCWEQCPFCSAICTNTISDHDGDHSVDFHRPTGIRGVEWYETDNLIIDICSSLVGSDCQMELSEDKFIPFRNYREAGPSYAKWSITPDSSLQPYWKWFVCQFQSDLEKYYSKKCHGQGEIPAQWKTITKSAAIESLKLST